MSLVKIIGSISSIIDKFVPTRLQRNNDLLRKLEKELEIALKNNDALLIATIRKQMGDIRVGIKETQS